MYSKNSFLLELSSLDIHVIVTSKQSLCLETNSAIYLKKANATSLSRFEIINTAHSISGNLESNHDEVVIFISCDKKGGNNTFLSLVCHLRLVSILSLFIL